MVNNDIHTSTSLLGAHLNWLNHVNRKIHGYENHIRKDQLLLGTLHTSNNLLVFLSYVISYDAMYFLLKTLSEFINVLVSVSL